MVHRRLRRETGRQARDVVMNIWHPVWRNWCLSAEAGRFYTQGCIQVCERTFSRRIVNRDSTPTTAKNIAGEARGENKRHPKSPEVGRFRPACNAEWLARDEGHNCQPRVYSEYTTGPPKAPQRPFGFYVLLVSFVTRWGGDNREHTRG
jgi:hypothetical protein